MAHANEVLIRIEDDQVRAAQCTLTTIPATRLYDKPDGHVVLQAIETAVTPALAGFTPTTPADPAATFVEMLKYMDNYAHVTFDPVPDED